MNINKILILSLLILTAFSCNEKQKGLGYITLQGETMGTYYTIKYKGKVDYKKDIDAELTRINNELSTYIPESTISRFNQSEAGITINKSDFWTNMLAAHKIYKLSAGNYDPTVMPLVNYWGFGYTGHKKPDNIDSVKVKELLKLVGFDKIRTAPINKDSIKIKKLYKDIKLDFSSIAKGYGVDKIGELLKKNGIDDYLVEIGGEVICSGMSPSNKEWTVGVNTPEANSASTDFIVKKQITNKAMATSGNYRNFYSIDGNKYSHTINPKTGFPEISNLLSATIIAPDCMTADALATACMVSGLEISKKMVSKLDSIEGCFIYLDANKEMKVYYSKGFE